MPALGAHLLPRRIGISAPRCIARTAFGWTVVLVLGALPLLAPVTGFAQGNQLPVAVAHTWQRIYYGKLDGQERLLFGATFERVKPTLGDVDGDGDADLLVGTARGTIMFFENRGSATAPDWRLANEALSAVHRGASPNDPAQPRDIQMRGNAAPALGDLDGDGDLDLLVGGQMGKLHFYRNVGNRFLAKLQLETDDFLGANLGENLVPALGDLNRDGQADLTVGNADGAVYLLINVGSRLTPRYCVQPESTPTCTAPRRKLAQLDPEDNAVPNWVDWDGDGDLDLMVGRSDGRMSYYRNIGTPREGVWEIAERRFQILDIGGYAAPLFHDVTGDGRPDLLLAGDGELVRLYANREERGQPVPWLVDRNVLRAARLGRHQSRIHIASGDLTGDGFPELIVGTRGGQLYYYENAGEKDGPAFRAAPDALLPTPLRSFSAPALADLDGDGDKDLVVGDRNGRLELIENTGTKREPRWRPVSLFMGEIDVGSMSTPAFHDLDGDKDLDLIVGNSLGNVVLYENRGTPTAPDFILLSIRFAGMKVPSGAAPAMFSYDAKAPPNLVVGSGMGSLFSSVRDPAVAAMMRRAYVPQVRAWEVIRAASDSAPHFVDLSGDGRDDLLLGHGDGTISYWRYEGAMRPEQMARRPQSPTRNIVPGTVTLPAERLDLGEGTVPQADPATLLQQQREELIPLDPIFVLEPNPIGTVRVGRATKLAFLDADGDGREDLIVGTADGKLHLVRNTTTGEAVGWERATDRFVGYQHGRNASPAVADLDGDGDRDLAVGTEEGRIHYWENIGTAKAPRFTHRPDVFASIRTDKNAVPAFAFLNRERRFDLVVGGFRGRLALYRRQPGPGLNFELATRRFAGLDVGINAAPKMVALVRRDVPVLLVGSDRGPIQVAIYPGNDDPQALWPREKSYLEGLELPAGSHPALTDLEGDGDFDLFVGSDEGKIWFYRNNALVPEAGGAPLSPPGRPR